MFISFAEDISSDLKQLKVDTKKSKENHLSLTKRFCNVVQLYADVKELSATYGTVVDLKFNFLIIFLARLTNDFNTIYKCIIPGKFLWSLSTICVSLLVLLSELVG